MSLFLASCPVWLGALLVVILPTALAMSGPVLVRRRITLERLTSNNEIAGFKFATVGVIYAVLLAFAVIVAWERFSDAEVAVVQEAGAAASLYRLSAGEDAQAVALRGALTDYLRTAIDKDWSAMAQQKASPEVTQALNRLYEATMRLAQGSVRPAPLLGEIFSQLDHVTQARRSRLHLASGILPGMLWAVLVTGGILTVAFTFFFGTQNVRAQALMTGILAVIVFMGLFVIISINYPFTGPVHIEPDPLEAVLQAFAHP